MGLESSLSYSPQGILVRAPNWIGDQVLSYPFFYYLRKNYPKARIAVACMPWVEDIQFRDLVDDVFTLQKPVRPGMTERWRVIEEGASRLRKNGRWDLGISLPNSFSSALLLWRSNAKRRRGFSAEGRGILLNDSVARLSSHFQHRAQSYLDLLPDKKHPKKDALEFWGIPPTNPLDEGVPGELQCFDPGRSWPNAQFQEPPHEPYWVLAPGSMAASRKWSAESFIALSRRIFDETRLKGVIVGGPAESPLAEQICHDRSLKLSDWTGRGSVASYSKIFRNSRFTVSNDSGLAHVAALCGSFVQIIWGAGNPKHTKPLGPGRVRLLFNPVECWPCERNTCSQSLEKKFQCLKGIQPDAVWEEIQIGIRSQAL